MIYLFLIIMTGIGIIIWQNFILSKNIVALSRMIDVKDVLLKDWLFQQLYKIKPSVTLPGIKTEDIKPGKATVYSPEEDPMSEFTSGLDDFYGDRK